MSTRTDGMRIDRAALRTQDGKVYSLPKPARHHNVIHHMHELGISMEEIARADQGFVTECGVWCRRAPAKRIAQKAGQLIRETHPTALFSEDVW
jgi:hypothetical protein